LDFVNALPSDCSITPAPVVDPEDPNFRPVFINCPESTYQHAVDTGVIPTFSAMSISWAISTDAAGYRIALADAGAGVAFSNTDQAHPNFSRQLSPGLYSLTVRVLDLCGNFSAPTQTAIVNIKQ